MTDRESNGGYSKTECDHGFCACGNCKHAHAEMERLRRQVEFLEALADGGPLLVNGIPWREMFDRLNAIVSDPVEPVSKDSSPTSEGGTP